MNTYVREKRQPARAATRGRHAVVNQERLEQALKRTMPSRAIYVLGYYSSNPDRERVRRRSEARGQA